MEKDELRALLQGRFDTWFERTMIQRPSYEHGESASIRFRVGRDTETGEEGEDYWNATVEMAEDVNCDESLNAMRKLLGDGPIDPGPPRAHVLHGGLAICGFLTTTHPEEWPDGHTWVPKSLAKGTDGHLVTCPACKKLIEEA